MTTGESELFLGKWETIPDFDDPRISVLSDAAVIEVYNEIEREFERFAKEETADSMLSLFFLFVNGKGHVDMDIVFRNEIEKIPDYPPPLMFETSTDNDVLIWLRGMCLRSGYVPYSDSIKTFYSVYTKFFTSRTSDNIADFITEEEISKLTPHETRLMLEWIDSFVFEDNYLYPKLLARIDSK